MEQGLEKKMENWKHRAIGLMFGIAAGFAAWGSQKTEPDSWRKAEPVQQAAQTWKEEKTDGAAEAKTEVLLHAQSAVLMDADSGRILYGKDEHQVRPMASTTKIMTCILALELGKPDDFCEVSKNAAAQPKVRLGAPAGSSFRLQDLLYSLMLESHNDSAVVIAEHISGSVEAFAEEMNRKALEIGCVNTKFLTPNGLDAEGENVDGKVVRHSTTAADLAQILRYCTKTSPKRDEFLTITRCRSYAFSDRSGQNTYSCQNHNALLNMTQEAVTGKTGFTGEAGYCYAAELSDGGRTFILTLLGCGWPPHKTWKWEDVRRLYRYGKEHFAYRDFVFEEKKIRIPLLNGAYKDWIYAVSENPEQKRIFHLLVSETERPVAEYDFKKVLEAPVNSGEWIGVVRYRLEQDVIGQSRYCAEEAVQAWEPVYCLRRVLDCWMFSGS